MQIPWSRFRDLLRSPAAHVLGQHPPWRSKSVIAAVVAMAIGLVSWHFDTARNGPTPLERPIANSGGSGSTGASLGGEVPSAGRQSGSVSRARSPALFRLGAGYLGGFFIGWSFRRFLKLSLLASAAAVAAIAALKTSGAFDIDWDALSGQVAASFAWLQGEAAGFKALVTGYLPSATAGGVGLFRGFWRK